MSLKDKAPKIESVIACNITSPSEWETTLIFDFILTPPNFM